MPALKLHEFLPRLPLFSELNSEDLEHVVSAAHIREFDRGDILFLSGEKPDGMYCVLEGQIKLALTSPSGAEKIVDIMGPGRSFAEALMFYDRPSPVTAQAVKKSAVAFIPGRVILGAIQHSDLFARRMLAGLSARLHHLIADLEMLCLQSSMQRVIGALLSEVPAQQVAGALRVQLPANKNLIASRLNLTPETFSRALHELSDEGLIAMEGKEITILNLERLKRYGQVA